MNALKALACRHDDSIDLTGDADFRYCASCGSLYRDGQWIRPVWMEAVRDQQETVPLTDRQRKVFRFVRDYIVAHGFAPKLREIGGALCMSNVTVKGHVDALVYKGLLVRTPCSSRGLALAGKG